ncbi:MAG: DUF1015 domain-containing protein, partial [Thermanaerothrix sp.]|nr:DUF1015 domain-containing protein [Thermanaerothrix sp.]
RYLEANLFETYTGLIYVERTVGERTRRGLILALDLEKYEFTPGAQSLIRATEGTILERIPPRMRIREGAVLELPHILVLIDDPERTVIEPVAEQSERLPLLYDFDLMLGSGHLRGRWVNDPALEQQVVQALERLASPEVFYTKYGVDREKGVLLFAVGDGNHSLATAKSVWEKIKTQVGPDHPARYALVEIENLYDEGLEFEPIHRVIFNTQRDMLADLRAWFGERLTLQPCTSEEEMVEQVHRLQPQTEHRFGVISAQGYWLARISQPESNLPVGTLQAFLDAWLKQQNGAKIDYIHGREVVNTLGRQFGNVGFYLPSMPKTELFRTVILDGVLPRKTFSMGEAIEKRFYMEARRIA